ncbi:hypothetical protein ACTXMW_04925 [Brachybacterium paraconglomeratum]|uniref:hypothetical protein n=1 Tax=Brachybacterium paraconglomeratum TaxID=173362 RepID=UPI003FCF66AD
MVLSGAGHGLPDPNCDSGYPIEQLVRELGEEHREPLREFSTMRASVECPEHGIVMYVVDVERYVEQQSSRSR